MGQTQLGLKLVGDIAGAFFVPAYQRGYRWDREQVSLLITDIWDNQDKDYCLQPVVVKRRADGRLELIDGQQRLTTLYLIFFYMEKEKLQNFDLPFTIEYETRPRSYPRGVASRTPQRALSLPLVRSRPSAASRFVRWVLD